MIDGSGVGAFGGGVIDLDDFFELAFETVVIEEDDEEVIEGDREGAFFSTFCYSNALWDAYINHSTQVFINLLIKSRVNLTNIFFCFSGSSLTYQLRVSSGLQIHQLFVKAFFMILIDFSGMQIFFVMNSCWIFIW